MGDLIITAIIAFIIGLIAGISAANDSLINDCKHMKQFRLSEKVYECKLMEKKND